MITIMLYYLTRLSQQSLYLDDTNDTNGTSDDASGTIDASDASDIDTVSDDIEIILMFIIIDVYHTLSYKKYHSKRLSISRDIAG